MVVYDSGVWESLEGLLVSKTGGVSDRLVFTVFDISRVASLECCVTQRYCWSYCDDRQGFGWREEAADMTAKHDMRTTG